jgi:Flp pilus assembly protein TadD
VVLALAARTAQRNEDYRDPVAMWADVAAQRPDNPRAYNNLGNALERQGYLDEAAHLFRKAILLQPDYPNPYGGLGRVLEKQHQPEAAEQAFRQALRCDPSLAPAHNNLGHLLIRRGDYSHALFHLREAIRLDAGDPLPHGNLGMLFLLQQKWTEAAEAYQQALARAPQDAVYHRSLGFALSRLGRPDESRREYAASLRLDPHWPEAALRDAWDRATSPAPAHRQGDDAVLSAAEAVEAVGQRDPRALDVLAAAYAAAGRYREAVETARRARSLTGQAALAKEIDGRLRLYLSGRPFRRAGRRGD